FVRCNGNLVHREEPSAATLTHTLSRVNTLTWPQNFNLKCEKSVRTAGNRIRSTGCGASRRQSRQGCQHRGQFHAKHRATCLPVVAGDPTSVLLHDSIANAQP